MDEVKDVANAELIEIRPQDGAQKYKLDRPVNGFDVDWITGWPRASNVKVGDKGKIIYHSTNSYGLHFFVKDEFMPPIKGGGETT